MTPGFKRRTGNTPPVFIDLARTDEKRMFQPFKTVSNIVQTATEKFRSDAVNV